MKNAIWKILTLALVVALLAISCKSCNRKKELAEVYNDLQRKDTVIRQFRDKAGAEHTLATARQLTIEQLKRSNEKDLLAIKAEVGHWRNLYSYAKFGSTTTGAISTIYDTVYDTAIVVDHDTIKVPVRGFKWKDSWLSIDGVIYPDSAKIGYDLRNEFTVTNKFVRPKWYKGKELQLSIVSDNPNTTIGSVQNLVVKPEQKKWYQSKGFAFGAGIVSGLFANRLIK